MKDGTNPEGVRLCTFGNVVYEQTPVGGQDVETYLALSRRGLSRLYLVARSASDASRVNHISKVIVVAVDAGHRSGLARILFAVGAARVGIRLHRRGRVDVFASSDPLVSGIVGVVVRTITRKPLLVHVQSELISLDTAWTGGLRRRVMSVVTRWVCRRADKVRCVSRSIAETVIRSGIPVAKVVYLPPRVDLDRFDPATRHAIRGTARRGFGFGDEPVVLFVGSLTARKGVDRLIGTLPAVMRRFPNVKVLIVGAGTYRRKLESLVSSMAVADHVMFAGTASHDVMPRVFAAADVLVLPSLNEGLPRVILEAMASGLPVVATDVGGVSEVVKDGRTGRLVPPANDGELAEAIVDVLARPSEAGSWVAAARDRVEREYERRANLDGYARLVRSLVPDRSDPGAGDAEATHRH